jgi:hypothetical protein
MGVIKKVACAPEIYVYLLPLRKKSHANLFILFDELSSRIFADAQITFSVLREK